MSTNVTVNAPAVKTPGSGAVVSGMENDAPAFYIRNIPIHGRLFLAPMAGFSDGPYRLLCRRLGAAFAFTEFISTDGVRQGRREVWQRLRFRDQERPVILQLFGNNPDVMLYSARLIEEMQPDVIDINMGCSVRAIAHKGSGAGMLRDPLRTGRIIERLVRHLHVPVTAKIRLGWDAASRNYLEMAHVLESSGVAMISVHGRTRAQGYGGQADWEAIGEIKARSNVPVLGNGDVTSRSMALERRRQTGVDGILIGRGAMGNPWIFQSDRQDGQYRPDRRAVLDTMQAHLRDMQQWYGERGLMLFRKHAARYLDRIETPAATRRRLLTGTDPEEFVDICLDLRDAPGC